MVAPRSCVDKATRRRVGRTQAVGIRTLARQSSEGNTSSTHWGKKKAEVSVLNTGVQRREKRQQLEVRIKEQHRVAGAQMVKQLKAIDMDGAEYALLRSKQMYYVGGNEAGRLLAHQLQAQVVQCLVNSLQTLGGAITTDDALILKEFEDFYLQPGTPR
ncbi:hypothetical protein NDU88_003783 [Pleurodeles waltl]|uniref:Uncharacterized protein n=1 Tax=Pleurodeles waltl TaxID=8319 RepID=A0AAV7WT92_PLEWA|nr:hypothetical protein NDU88_003783 [Pleurodeles waltl]